MARKRTGIYFFTICLFLTAFFLCSCTPQALTTYLSDVITMKASAEDKTQITMMSKNGVRLDAFEKAAEEKFSDIDLVIVGSYTNDHNAEIAKRLERDDLTDLICFSSPSAGETFQSARLLDLSGLPFTNDYTIASLNDVRKDGKVYMVPLPRGIECIVYNKTFFYEEGYEVPTDFDSFCQLSAKINNDFGGETRGFRASLYDDHILRETIFMFGYEASFQNKDALEWLSSYRNREEGASFSYMRPAYDNFLKLVECGAVRTEGEDNDFTYRTNTLSEDLLSRSMVMTIGNAELLYDLNRRSGENSNADEFGVLPFYSAGEDSDWVMECVSGYYAMNKNLKANAKKYDAAYRIMEFLSSEEGQQILISDGNGNKSNLVPSQRSGEMPWQGLNEIETTLSRGRICTANVFRSTAAEAISKALNDTFANTTLSAGQITDGEGNVVDAIGAFHTIAQNADEGNLQNEVDKGKYLGAVSEDFSLADTGSFIAEAMRIAAEADIALYLDMGKDGVKNSLGVAAKFYLGELKQRDLYRILPELPSEDYGKLVTVMMRGEQILTALEYALYESTSEDGFYYFSGLTVEYKPTAERGKRVVSVTLENGVPLNKSYAYVVAISNGTVSPDYYVGEADTGRTVRGVVEEAVKRRRTLSPSNHKQFLILP